MSTQTIAPPALHLRTNCGPVASNLPRISLRVAERQGVEISQPWQRSRTWPCSADEEATFVVTLNRRATTPTHDFDRRDVTSLVTALRSGLTADELLDLARGLKPARLVAAYNELDRRRCISADAWRVLSQDGTAAALERYIPHAALLLRGIAGQVVRDVQRTGDVSRVVADAAARIDRSTNDVLALEHQLGLDTTTARRAKEIGAMLNDGHETGAWNWAAFLPSRVGSLVPLRVAALLGEQPPNGANIRW
jgi:hypothetical protein